MRKIPFEELKKGDVVLLEVTVRRWLPAPDDNAEPSSGTSTICSAVTTRLMEVVRAVERIWSAWNVGFRMESISLLYKGSDFHVGNVPDEDVLL